MFSLLSAMAAPEAGSAPGGSMMTTFVTFGLIIAIFYLLLIRPQRKKDKETREMLASIKKGDKVVSIGGIHGTVMVVKESSVVVKVDDNTRIEFARNAISSIVQPKGAPAPVKAQKKVEAEETPAPAKKQKKAAAKEAPAKQEKAEEAASEAAEETEEK